MGTSEVQNGPHGWNQEIKVTRDGITGQEAGGNLYLDWPRKDEKNLT